MDIAIKENVTCYDMAKKKEALFDDPAMVAYQMEELLTRVLGEKEEVLPPMKKEIDWQSFEETLRLFISIVYSMDNW